MKHIYGNYIYRQFANEYNFLCVIKKEGKSNLDFSSFLITSKFGLHIVFRVGNASICIEGIYLKECIYRKSYATIEEIARNVFEYIELFYNGKRIHSVLGYMSSVEYRLIKYS